MLAALRLASVSPTIIGEFLVSIRLNETKRTGAGTKTPDDTEYPESLRVKSVSFEGKLRWHEAS